MQSILWPVLEDWCDTRSVSEENDSTMAQIYRLVCWKWKEAESEYMLRKSTLPGCCLWTGWSCLHCPQGLTLLSMDRGKKKSQAAHCAPGGTPSLPSVLCACGSSSSFPSNIAMLLNQGIPKLMYTQLGERRGRECHFALSSPSITLQAWIAGD